MLYNVGDIRIIPASAYRPGGEIGRRRGLKIPRRKVFFLLPEIITAAKSSLHFKISKCRLLLLCPAILNNFLLQAAMDFIRTLLFAERADAYCVSAALLFHHHRAVSFVLTR